MIPEPSEANGGDVQLLADLFHALSQPLTTLRCGLGLSLQKSAPDKQDRRDLEIASRAAESVAQLVAGIRELMEAATCSSSEETADLPQCLRGLVDDLRPVAESMQLALALTSANSIEVGIEPLRLRQALFHLLGFALESCAAGNELRITAAERDENALLTVQGRASASPPPADHALQMRLALAIAARIFETAAGRMHLRSSAEYFSLTIELPRKLERTVGLGSCISGCCA